MGDPAAADLPVGLSGGLPVDLSADLMIRWWPSVAQVALADALLAISVGYRPADERVLHIAHLLLSKM